MSTRFEERSRFRLSVMWVLLLSGAACSCARDGASRTLLLVSVEVSEARSSTSTLEVDTVHSDERTISLAVIFVFIIYVRFIGIFYYPETPSDLRSGLDLVYYSSTRSMLHSFTRVYSRNPNCQVPEV